MTFLTLLPLLISLALIIFTRRTMLSLLCGAVVGGVIFLIREGGNGFTYLWDTVWGALANPWHYSALVFTVLLGGFAALLQAGGGLSRLFQGVNSPRALEARMMGIGFLCFFDGLANSLLLGRLVRPMADRMGVSREKLAYLADTTSSSIACLAPVSTWIAMQLGLISVVLADRGMEASPYALFLKSLPFNFYCLFSLLLAVVIVISGRDFGPMKKTRPIPPEQVAERGKGGLFPPLFSVGFLLFSIPFFYYLFSVEEYFPLSFQKVADALGSNEGPKVFMLSSALSLLLLFFLSHKLSVGNRMSAISGGMKQMFIPLGVLLCAWFFGAVMKDLGIAETLTSIMGESVELRFFPCLVFLLGCVLSFTTGTSWGTMALLFPLAFGMIQEVPNEELLPLIPLLSAAIFSGAVFGDHCSPYSDTTIVSAVASGCSAYAHVRTQLPYALVCGTLAALFFLMTGWVNR